MLDPEYLLRISEGAEEIAEKLHIDIINRIIDRMMERINRGETYLLTATDKWQLEILKDAGFLLEDIQKEIAARTKEQETEIKKSMEEAGIKGLEHDDEIYRKAGLSPVALKQSPHLIRIMQRNYEATMGEWYNFTRTTANASQQAFISAMDKAYNLVSTGTISYSQAVSEALKGLISEGITVTYPSGHTDTIETATLRAVRTGISQMSRDITDARMEEMNWDIILTSAHLGARVTPREDYTNHSWWQGKFYSRSGQDERFPPYSVCGDGDVQGIHGANCRHSHGPGDGEHNPFKDYDSEENKKRYELEQRQRMLERRIRKTKREVMNWKEAVDHSENDKVKFENDLKFQKKAMLLEKQNKAYNDFCTKNGLKSLSERLEVAKWNRKYGRSTIDAAKRYKAAKGIKD